MERSYSLLRRIACVFVSLAVAFSLCGCAIFDSDISTMITAPSPSGELKDVKKALERSAGTQYTLKHPASGDYLSPIVLKDINGDGTDEAFVFYSTVVDGALTMHITFISKRENKWETRSDSTLTAGGVDKIFFSDLDSDGVLEIVVGWRLYGDIEKQVSVYDLHGGVLVQRLAEKYTFYCITDLNSDGQQNILTCHLNTTDKTASAKLFAVKADGISEIGNCGMDAGVSQYSSPIISALEGGKTAIYIDAVKGTGMITEILYYENGTLHNPFLDPATLENTATFRPSVVACRDFNGDGRPEIPLLTLLPGSTNPSDPSYLTRWCSFDGTTLSAKSAVLMNYNDGYSIALPTRWNDQNISIVRKVDARLRTIMLWDPVAGNATQELLRIKAVDPQEWDKTPDSHGEYTEIVRSETYVIAAAISSYTGPEAVSAKEVAEMIRLIG